MFRLLKINSIFVTQLRLKLFQTIILISFSKFYRRLTIRDREDTLRCKIDARYLVQTFRTLGVVRVHSIYGKTIF